MDVHFSGPPPLPPSTCVHPAYSEVRTPSPLRVDVLYGTSHSRYNVNGQTVRVTPVYYGHMISCQHLDGRFEISVIGLL